MKYFVIEGYMAQTTPNLAITKGGIHVSKNKPLPPGVDLVVGAVGNVQSTPTLFDWHWTPHPIVTDKVRATLEPLKLHQIEFHDVELTLGDYEGPPYSLLRIRNRLNVFDTDGSDFEKGASGDILTIKRLVLDKKKLAWAPRRGIELLPGEGYARRVMLAPGWIDDDKAVARQDWIALRFMPPFTVATPVLELDAVRPSENIRWGEAESVYVPASRALPYSRRPESKRPAEMPTGEVDLILILPQDLRRGDDVDMCYLIGNTGTDSIWVDQHSLTPAFASWTIKRYDRIVAEIDGSLLDPLAEMAPKRPLLLLHPGEYLAFRRVVPFDQLEIGKSRSADITLNLCLNDFGRDASSPNADSKPLAIEITERIQFAK